MMNRKRIAGALAAFALVSAAFVAVSSPQQVQADPIWPKQTSVYPQSITAVANNALSIFDCGSAYSNDGRSGAPGQAFILGDTVKTSSMFGSGTDSYLPWVTSCGPDTSVLTPDGTLYTGAHLSGSDSNNTDAVVRESNSRIQWSTVVDLCPTKTIKAGVVDKMAMGADGNIYAIMQSAAGYSDCPTKLVVFTPSTGATTLTSQALSTTGSYSMLLSTYASEVVVRDKSGEVYYYDNGGSLVSGTSSYSSTSNYPVYNAIWSDESETVYTISHSTSTCSGPLTVTYRERSGTIGSYSISLDDACSYDFEWSAPIPSGGVAILQGNGGSSPRVTVFKPGGSTSGTSLAGIATPSGVYYGNLKIAADSTGNIVTIDQYITASSGNSNVIAQYYDFGASTVSTVWSGTSALTGQNNLNPVGKGDIVAGDLYQAICYGGCYPNRQNSWIQKIPLTGFGAVYEYYGTFVSPVTSTELQYVAMGDSFSSGEGNMSYLLGSDVSGSSSNQCHRSGSAYSEWLAQTPSLKLNLIDFVACSGATTADILGTETNHTIGNWNEPAQISALTDATKVVTITVGGNDIGFAAYARACIQTDCDTSTSIYNTTLSSINNDLPAKLHDVYSSILTHAPNAQIYVIGYPQIAPADATSLPVQCQYFNSSNGTGLDAYAARQIVSTLNTTIGSAVSYENSTNSTTRLTFIDPNASINGTFDGHDVCQGSNAYFYNVTWDAVAGAFIYPIPGTDNPAEIFHPNVAGQYEYYNIVAGAIS